MKGCLSKKIISSFLSLALCATAVPMVSLSSSAAGTVTPKVATGENHTVVLKADGSVWATGSNSDGQLGINKTSTEVPKTATFTQCVDDTGAIIKDATDIACGSVHTAVIRAGGQLWQCGNNGSGQLGTETSGTKTKFEQSYDKNGAKITDATAVACGYAHTAVIRAGGQLWQCGNNGSGQLGTEIKEDKSKFEQSKDANGAITNVAAVSNGSYANATLILRPDANGDLELLGAGRNENGELGLGQENGRDNYNSPQTKFIKSAIVDISKAPTSSSVETITEKEPSKVHDVTGVGEFIGATSVTITWGDLTYNYNAKWDPATQTWVQNDDQEFWTVSSTDADKITATNNSSKAYKVVLSFKPDPAYEASKADGTKVEGSFVTTSFGADEITNNTLNLTTAEREKTAYLKLSGMSDKITGVEDLQNQTFGVVTATLQDPDAQQSGT